MSIFHHSDDDPEGADDTPSASFEVVGADGKILRYARDDFDGIFETTDPAEVQQQVDRGWVILDERLERRGGRGPSAMDTIPETEALRADGLFPYQNPEEVTVYTVGFLKEDAHGTPEE